jgi:hypothetical protein
VIDRSLLRSSVVEPIPQYHVPVLAYYTAACKRTPLTERQCSVTFNRTSVAIEHTCRTCYIYVYAIDRTALRSSAPLLPASTYPWQYVHFLFLEVLINC